MESNNNSKGERGRYTSRIFWITITAMIGVTITTIATLFQTLLMSKNFEVLVKRSDYQTQKENKEGKIVVSILNSGDLLIKDFRLRFWMEIGSKTKINPITKDLLSSNQSCQFVKREQWTADPDWEYYGISYTCDYLNPGETMYYFVEHQKMGNDRIDGVRDEFGINIMIRAEGYTYKEYLFSP